MLFILSYSYKLAPLIPKLFLLNSLLPSYLTYTLRLLRITIVALRLVKLYNFLLLKLI